MRVIKDIIWLTRGNWKDRLLVLVLFLIPILAILWGIYQFNLCYPEISDSVLYCLQHSF